MTIEVERIDPAEALRRIRTELLALANVSASRERRRAYCTAVQVVESHWPNGAQP